MTSSSYAARYRTKCCGIEVTVTLYLSHMSPDSLVEGYGCLGCRRVLELPLLEVGTTLEPVPDAEYRGILAAPNETGALERIGELNYRGQHVIERMTDA